MNKNEQARSNTIESHRKSARYKRLLYAQKGRVDTRSELIHALEEVRLVEQKSNIFDEPILNDPLRFYNQHLGGHQMPRQNLSKIYKISLLRVCKRLKILVNGC